VEVWTCLLVRPMTSRVKSSQVNSSQLGPVGESDDENVGSLHHTVHLQPGVRGSW
jgi:hypothetical protein